MKGLFVKDILLIKNQKRSLPLLFLCGAVMSATMQPMTSIIYLGILGAMLAVGTISYDELDHGYSYLFTLPVGRKTYVREKYIFCILFCLLCAALGAVMGVVVSIAKGMLSSTGTEEFVGFVFGSFLAVSLMIGTLIPTRIKYGTEKSSIVMFVLFGLLAAVALAISKAGSFLPETVIKSVKQFLENANDAVMTAAVLLVAAAGLFLSERISERIILRKEY